MAKTDKVKFEIEGKDNASKATKSFGSSLKKMGAGVRDVSLTLNAMIGITKAVGGAMGAVAGKFKEVIDLAKEQELAEVKLVGALRIGNELTLKNFDALTAQASALQKVTRFGDETTMGVQALLISMGGLSAELTKRATPAILDFAELGLMDANTAAITFAKTVGSATNAFIRYGVIIDNSLRGTERAVALMDAMAKSSAGMAELVGETASGALQKMSNNLGDLKEKLGLAILKADAFQAGVTTLTSLFGNLSDALNQDSKEWRSMADAVSTALHTIIMWTFKAGDAILGVFTTAFIHVARFVDGMKDLTIAWSSVFTREQAIAIEAAAGFILKGSEAAADARLSLVKLKVAYLNNKAAAEKTAKSTRELVEQLERQILAAKNARAAWSTLGVILMKVPFAVMVQNMKNLAARTKLADSTYGEFINSWRESRKVLEENNAFLALMGKTFVGHAHDVLFAAAAAKQLAQETDDAEQSMSGLFNVLGAVKGAMEEASETAFDETLRQMAEPFEVNWEEMGDSLSLFTADQISEMENLSDAFNALGEDILDIVLIAAEQNLIDSLFGGFGEGIGEAGGALDGLIEKFKSGFTFIGKLVGKALGGITDALISGVIAVGKFVLEKILGITLVQTAEETAKVAATATSAIEAAALAVAWAPAAVAAAIATQGAALAFGATAKASIAAAALPMAEGGIVDTPGGVFAQIGEAGPEAVIPLDEFGGGGMTINLNLSGEIIEESAAEMIAEAVAEEIESALSFGGFGGA